MPLPIQDETPALCVRGLAKRYPRRRSLREFLTPSRREQSCTEALRDVTFTLKQGELVGLLGPNGAGKTTLLKVLCGLVFPNEGEAEVLGVSTASPRVPHMLGLANGDERSFYWRLTARENLNFFARLHGLHRQQRRARVAELLATVELEGEAERRFADLSAGMKQRLAIARALLSDAPVLLMDEPTRSLDPLHTERITSWIRNRLHGELGKSILLATHDLHVAQRICDRVLVLVGGRLRMDGSPSDLAAITGSGILYRIRLQGVPADVGIGRVVERCDLGGGVCEARISFEAEEQLHVYLETVIRGAGRVLACSRIEPDIETGFVDVVSPGRAPDGGMS